MKFSLFSFIVLAVIPAASLAASSAVFERPAADLGTLTQGKKVDHIFRFRNKGDSPLVIGKITTSCGCTAANVTSRSVAPGATGEIRVTFDSTSFSGPVTKTVTVETNDSANPVATLTLKGVVAEVIAVAPKQLALGTLKEGERKEVVVTIENRGTKPLAVLGVKSPQPQIVPQLRKAKAAPGEKAEIAVTVEARKGDRIVSGYVLIETDSELKKEIIVPVFASVAR